MTISARVITDSTSPAGIRLTTMQLRYPKFIHGEFLTHRTFSRNSSSSRAIPVERLIQDVLDDPVIPTFWGKNQKGMQATEEHHEWVDLWDSEGSGSYNETRERAWLRARDDAMRTAACFAAAGYHKQIVNRLLEPFCHINTVVTATEWSNFFALRCHPDAQPEMRMLAEAMRDTMAASTPKLLRRGEWHLPYVTNEDRKVLNDLAVQDAGPGSEMLGDSAEHDRLVPFFREAASRHIKVSVARCARVSYLTQDGRRPGIDDDLELYDRLVGAVPLHASPCEHQATPDQLVVASGCDPGCCCVTDARQWQHPSLHGNLRGWCQYRKMLSRECQ